MWEPVSPILVSAICGLSEILRRTEFVSGEGLTSD